MRLLTAVATLLCVAGVELPAHAQFANDNVVTDQYGNTGAGTDALFSKDANPGIGGGQNTAFGEDALYNDTTGCCNTAVGQYTLLNNTIGYSDTAIGLFALASNTTGFSNTAAGVNALQGNTTGTFNTAMGHFALASNTTATSNSAYGFATMNFTTTGSNNTATGYEALYTNKIAANNSAYGYQALYASKGGSNTAMGRSALHASTTGTGNIGIGYLAGGSITTGSNNIDIGSQGVSGDTNTIRIGSAQSATFIAGISGSAVRSGAAVVISADGQLGISSSSERYKTAITSMGESTEKLARLRPVTFRFKADHDRVQQYGLIAEEVAQVYPELVIRDKKGRIESVRYDELAPMLLNLAQHQAAEIAALREHQEQMQTALTNLQSTDRLVAQR